MTLGAYAYGSATYAGKVTIVRCSAPSANLVVMENLLRIGYTQEEISTLYRCINQI
jgi:hypothetical protein